MGERSAPMPKNARSLKTRARETKETRSTGDVHAHFRKGQVTRVCLDEDRILKESCLDLTRMKVLLDDDTNLDELLYEAGVVLKNVTLSSGFNLYIVNEEKKCLTLMTNKGLSKDSVIPLAAGTLVADAALTKECERLQGEAAGAVCAGAAAAMAVPFVRPDGACHAVLELARTEDEAYDDHALYTAAALACWAATAVHQCREARLVRREVLLHERLTQLLTEYFCDGRGFEETLGGMLDIIKTRLLARRASFYVVDVDADGEMTATAWEEGWPGPKPIAKKKLKINLSAEKSPAALAARSGTPLNVPDATRDARFVRAVHAARGEPVRAVLVAPVVDKCGVCGVVQLFNKRGDSAFSAADEELFQVFVNYCSLLIHYYKVASSREYKESLSMVYEDIMGLHLRSCPHDYEQLMSTNGVVEPPPGFFSPDFYIGSDPFDQKSGLAVFMLIDIIGEKNIVRSVLVDFVLTVFKCYRKNPYHNAIHAFTFTHTMYLLLLANRARFTMAEAIGFMLAGICHDLDHPGLNNNFLAIISHPLAKMYKGSILEHHHFNLARKCIQINRLLEKLPKDTQEQIMTEIKYDILCTDLAFYFQTRALLAPIVSERIFDWNNEVHRKYIKGLMMTTSDLSGNCKPPPMLKEITLSVYEEFYNQGDKERAMGLVPLSMMDRRRAANQPAEQLQFLSVVVMPCLQLLQSVCPGITEWADNCRRSMDTWREELEKKESGGWRSIDST